MTPRAAVAIASAGALSWVVLGFLALLLFALSGCATVRTPRGIAMDFATCFEDQTPRNTRLGSGWPLVHRCQCLEEADTRCVLAGYPVGCWRDGWVDADHDSWAVAACRRMQEETP